MYTEFDELCVINQYCAIKVFQHCEDLSLTHICMYAQARTHTPHYSTV